MAILFGLDKETDEMTTLVAIDDGSSQIKAAKYTKDGKIETICFPSEIVDGILYLSNGDPQPGAYITEEGMEYTIKSHTEQPLSNAHYGYQYSPRNRCLVFEALRRLNVSGDIFLCNSIPVDLFFNDRAMIEKKKDNIQKSLTNVSGYKLPKIARENHRIYPEAAVGWADIANNDDGSFNEDYENVKRVAFLDLGGFSRDSALIDVEEGISKIRTDQFSVQSVHKNFQRLLSSELNKPILPLSVLDEALKTGVLTASNLEDQDVSNLAEKALYPLAEKAIDDILYLDPTLTVADRIVMIGGGSKLLENHPRTLEFKTEVGNKLIIPEDAPFSIVKGMLKSRQSELLTIEEAV